MEYVNQKEFMQSKQFIKEPIELCVKEVKDSSEKLIILGPNQGRGRTLLLNYLEQLDIENPEEKTIYMKFDEAQKFPNKYLFLQEHYYELIVALNVLYYIKKNHQEFFKNHFIEDWYEINYDINATLTYYHNRFSTREPIFNKFYCSKELVKRILKEWKKGLAIKKCNLIIDSFDHTNHNSEMVQQILAKYFDLFDQTILTTDDEESNHELWNLEYSKDPQYVMAILNGQRKANEEGLSMDQIEQLIESTNGNLNHMIAYIHHQDDKNQKEEQIKRKLYI